MVRGIKMDDFIDDIIESIEKLNSKTNELNGNTAWTDAVKNALINVAKKYGLFVNCNMKQQNQYENYINKELLYDIIIYTSTDDVLNEVYLVCESEWLSWSPSYWEKIKEDFIKLLFARSKVRLMVFEVFEEEYAEYKNKLINIIEKSNSSLTGDIYIFAIWHKSSTKNGFEVEKYIKGDQK